MPLALPLRVCVCSTAMNSPVKVSLPKLSEKYRIFADTYIETGNAAESARRSGSRSKHPGIQGYKILKRPEIIAYLEAKRHQIQESEEDLNTRIIDEFKKLAFANIADFITVDEDGRPQIDFSTATEEQLAVITSVKSKKTKRYNSKGEHIATDDEAGFRMADKYRGLENLARITGLLKDGEHRVVVDVADRLLAARARLAGSGSLGD